MTAPIDDPGTDLAAADQSSGRDMAGAPWRMVATSRFERDLGRLSPRIASAIVEFVTSVLPQNPLRLTKPLTGEFEALRSARRGDYRVIVRIDDQAHVVILHRAAHRAHVYRPG